MRRLLLLALAATLVSGCIAVDTMYDDHARSECDRETTPRDRGACYDRVDDHRRERR